MNLEALDSEFGKECIIIDIRCEDTDIRNTRRDETV